MKFLLKLFLIIDDESGRKFNWQKNHIMGKNEKTDEKFKATNSNIAKKIRFILLKNPELLEMVNPANCMNTLEKKESFPVVGSNASMPNRNRRATHSRVLRQS